jgi:hypothetical protein
MHFLAMSTGAAAAVIEHAHGLPHPANSGPVSCCMTHWGRMRDGHVTCDQLKILVNICSQGSAKELLRTLKSSEQWRNIPTIGTLLFCMSCCLEAGICV